MRFNAGRIAKNSVYLLGAQVGLLVLGLGAGRLVFERLGGDTLGLIYFVATASAVLASVAQLGIGATATREVAIHAPPLVADFLQSASVIAWLVWGLSSGLLWISAPYLTGAWLQLSTLTHADATWGLRLLGVTALLCVPRALYVGVLQGYQKIGLTSLLEWASVLLQQGGLLVVLLRGGTLRQTIFVLAATNVIALGLHLAACATLLSFKSVIPRWIPGQRAHPTNFLRTMTGISVVGLVHSYLPRVVVTGLLPLAIAGPFLLVSTIAARVSLAADALAQAAFPALAAPTGVVHSQGRYMALVRFACICTLPVVFTIGVLAGPMLDFVFNATVGRSLVLPLLLLCAGAYARAVTLIPYYAALATGKPWPAFLTNLELLPVMVPLSVGFVYAWGVVGAALTIMSYQMLVLARFLPRAAAIMKLTSRELIIAALSSLSTAAIAYSPAIILAILGGFGVLALSTALVIGTGLFAVALWRGGQIPSLAVITSSITQPDVALNSNP